MSPLVAVHASIAPPRPPPDPAPPTLLRALDPEAAAETLQGWLGRSGLAVRSCAPTYVRYKPGIGATIRYDVQIAAGADVRRHWVVVRLLTGDLAERKLARRRVGRLVAGYDRLPGVPPVANPATVLPELGAVALLFPLDPKLPGLAAAFDPENVLGLAGGSASVPGGESPEPEAVRYKPYRKALLRYGAASSAADIYLKLSLPDLAPALDWQARAFVTDLRNRGVRTAAPAAWVPSLAASTYPAVRGVPLRAMRGTTAALAHLPAVAFAVRAVAACDIADLPPYGPADEVATVRAAARMLGRLLPELTADLANLVRALERCLARLGGDLRPAHGDCYDDQFLTGPDGLTILDFDAARLAHPSLDPGNYLAHLHAATTDAPDDATRRNLIGAIEELVACWEPNLEEDALAVATAAGVLKLAVGPFRRLERSWPRRIAALVALAGQLAPPDRR